MHEHPATNSNLIPEKLINVRKHLGISKAEAARRVNLTAMGYGRYESGERTPSSQIVRALAEGLNTSVDYLTGKSDDLSSDTIIVCKKDTPELFALVEKCHFSDKKTIKRLVAYYQSIKEE